MLYFVWLTSVSMEDMKQDISKMNSKLRCFMNNLSHTTDKLQTMFNPFIEVSVLN